MEHAGLRRDDGGGSATLLTGHPEPGRSALSISPEQQGLKPGVRVCLASDASRRGLLKARVTSSENEMSLAVSLTFDTISEQKRDDTKTTRPPTVHEDCKYS